MGNAASSSSSRSSSPVSSSPQSALSPTSAVSEPEECSVCHACASATPGSEAVATAAADSASTSASSAAVSPSPCYAYSHSSCPLNRAELGRASWAYLHTLAAYYPTAPSGSQQQSMRQLMLSFASLYPCGYCADRTVEEMQRNPPRVQSQAQLAAWLCEVHNEVNERLHKPRFDCSRIDERWRTGCREATD